MAYCSQCGAVLPIDARFCPSCGRAVGAAAESVIPVMPVVNAAADYTLVLLDTGSCPRSSADDILEDILGYSNVESNLIISRLPAEIAQNLTAEQAQYIAQALTEYGMQVAIYRGDSAVDLGGYATSSVFNSDGSFVSGAVAALATISMANRMREIRRWTRPDPFRALFAPRYRPPAPPRHIRRSIFRPAPPCRPEPRPRPAARPRSEPPRTGAPRGGSRGPSGGGRGPSGGSRGPSGGSRGPSGGGRR